jgi:Uma2 family endonuclease
MVATMTTGREKQSKDKSSQLKDGARMNRERFHYLYEQTPEDFRVELIGGVVHEPSPISISHGQSHVLLTHLLSSYAIETPGVQLLDNVTVMLSDQDEVQPDLLLRVLPEFGGRTENTRDNYVNGPPELVVEIAHSSASLDLGRKRKRYSLGGVAEYLVICTEQKEIRWFDLPNNARYQTNDQGIMKSKMFPGLWLSPVSIIGNPNNKSAIKVLNQGLKSAEHADFVKKLSKRS